MALGSASSHRKLCLDESCPITRTDWQNGIVEVVTSIVEDAAAFRGSVSEPNIAAWPFSEHEGEVL
jgi:hypothetical protein